MSSTNKRNFQEDLKEDQVREKYGVIRIKGSVRNDLQFIKVIVGINANVLDGEVETLIKMFEYKKIGQLILRKGIRIPPDSDDNMFTFFNEETEKQ